MSYALQIPSFLSLFTLDRDQPVRLVGRLEREFRRRCFAAAAPRRRRRRSFHERRGLVPSLEDHLLYQPRRVGDLVPALAGAALDEDEALVPGRRVDLALRAGVCFFFFFWSSRFEFFFRVSDENNLAKKKRTKPKTFACPCSFSLPNKLTALVARECDHSRAPGGYCGPAQAR